VPAEKFIYVTFTYKNLYTNLTAKYGTTRLKLIKIRNVNLNEEKEDLSILWTPKLRC